MNTDTSWQYYVAQWIRQNPKGEQEDDVEYMARAAEFFYNRGVQQGRVPHK